MGDAQVLDKQSFEFGLQRLGCVVGHSNTLQ
jgi:hypothetical protein